MLNIKYEKVLNFLLVVNLALGIWIPTGRLKFRSKYFQFFCRFYEKLILSLFILTMVICAWNDIKLNFYMQVAFFGKFILQVIGYFMIVIKSAYLISKKGRIVEIICKFNTLLNSPPLKQFQIGEMAKLSKLSTKILICQSAVFLIIQTTVLSLLTIGVDNKNYQLSNGTDISEKVNKALGVGKWDNATKTFFVFVTTIATIRPYKSIAIDCLVFYFFAFIISQISILEKSLSAATSRGAKLKEPYFTYPALDISSWTDLRKKIAELMEEVNNLFAPVIFATILNSSVSMCTHAFSAAIYPSLLIITVLLLWMTWVALQVFSYCYIGQKMKNSGESLIRAIYREPWLQKGVNLASLMNMIAIDCQQTFVIRVGPFIVLSYEFFIQLLGAVITYFLIIVQYKD